MHQCEVCKESYQLDEVSYFDSNGFDRVFSEREIQNPDALCTCICNACLDEGAEVPIK